MVQSVEDLDSFRGVLESAGDKLVVVDFTAAWCGPCRQMAPRFQELSERPENRSSVLFLRVDVDEAADVAAACQITSMPTFHFYHSGKMVDQFTGAHYDLLLERVVALR